MSIVRQSHGLWDAGPRSEDRGPRMCRGVEHSTNCMSTALAQTSAHCGPTGLSPGAPTVQLDPGLEMTKTERGRQGLQGQFCDICISPFGDGKLKIIIQRSGPALRANRACNWCFQLCRGTLPSQGCHHRPRSCFRTVIVL